MSGFARKLQQVNKTSSGSSDSARLYLSPNWGTRQVGSTLVVDIYEDSGATPVNGVQANLTYPTAQLQYASSTNSGSAFTSQLQNTGGSGTVQIAVGTLSTPPTGPQLVASVTFNIIGTGAAAIAFDTGSAVTRANNPADILTSTTGGNYTCNAAGPSATMSLTPASGSYANGATITVTIYEDSGANAVNGVQANLTYPASKLQYVSSSNSTSTAFPTSLQNTGGGGTVQIAAGNLSASSTGSQLVATVTFTAIATGSASIAFDNGSAVALTSNGTDILTGTTGSAFTIT